MLNNKKIQNLKTKLINECNQINNRYTLSKKLKNLLKYVNHQNCVTPVECPDCIKPSPSS